MQVFFEFLVLKCGSDCSLSSSGIEFPVPRYIDIATFTFVPGCSEVPIHLEMHITFLLLTQTWMSK